jgi:hypothetical protein
MADIQPRLLVLFEAKDIRFQTKKDGVYKCKYEYASTLPGEEELKGAIKFKIEALPDLANAELYNLHFTHQQGSFPAFQQLVIEIQERWNLQPSQ